MVANPAPCLLARTGRALEYKTFWEEPPTTEDVAQVEHLLQEIADLLAQEWFVVANSASCLPVRTGHVPEYKACWEEPPMTEEMA